MEVLYIANHCDWIDRWNMHFEEHPKSAPDIRYAYNMPHKIQSDSWRSVYGHRDMPELTRAVRVQKSAALRLCHGALRVRREQHTVRLSLTCHTLAPTGGNTPHFGQITQHVACRRGRCQASDTLYGHPLRPLSSILAE
jgi:hypothetical protein